MRNFSLGGFFTLAVLLFIGIAYMGCLSQQGGGPAPEVNNPPANAAVVAPVTVANASSIDLNKYPELKRRLESYNAVKESKRPDYFGESLQSQMFQFLPPFPKDFYLISGMVELGILPNINDISADYYKQPEFIPRYTEVGVEMQRNPPTSSYGAFGFGSYPAELIVNFDTKNNTLGGETTAWFLIHSSWLTETYQGLKLNLVIPNETSLDQNYFSDKSREVKQNPDEVKNYITADFVSAEPQCSRGNYNTNTQLCEWTQANSGGCYAHWNDTAKTCSYTPSPSPDVILLEPAFPIFQYGWSQKIGLHVKVMPNTPKGKYIIGVEVATPPKEIGDKWFSEYKLLYIGGSLAGIGKPWLQMGIEVT